MSYRQIYVECECGNSVEVNDLETELYNEDWKPVEVKCECGERYLVELHMTFLGKGATHD